MATDTRIPTRSREVLKERDRGHCVRCTGPGTEVHHRRSRRVRDEHRHCPCNLVTLCGTCHREAHSHPSEAEGLMVSQWQPLPGLVRVKAWWGWVEMTCSGDSVWHPKA